MAAGKNGNGAPELIQNRMEFVRNLFMLRDDLTSLLSDRRRNIEDECGYPKEYDPRLYQIMFDTEAIANRVVSVLPDECSMVQPRIYEDDNDEVTTSFEETLRKLDVGLQGEDNYCYDEEGSALAEVIARADVVCGICRYGGILIGTGGRLGDSLDYSKPLSFRASDEPYLELLHLSCYPESMMRIVSFDENKGSRRYKQPEMYQIDWGGVTSATMPWFGVSSASLGVQTDSLVHWSRVVHVVDNPLTSRVFGVPRQQPVMRRLLDLQKAYAATGEAIWQVGVPGFSVESDPSLGGEVDFDPAQLKDSVERYINGFQRWMLSNGFVIKTLAPNIADFTPHMASLLEAICIQLAIPMRVFRGSEVGERASMEDAKRWRVKVASRRRKHLLPNIIRPLINRLIALGCLAKPGKGGYHVWWPDVETNTPDEQSNIALKGAQALDAYTRGMGREVMDPFNFLVTEMGLTEVDARRVMEDTEKFMKERQKILQQQARSMASSAPGSNGQGGNSNRAGGNPGAATSGDVNAAAVQNFFGGAA